MKKILLAVITLFVAFAFTYAIPSNRVQGAVLSKAATITAKKVIKEVTKETAKEIAFEMALQAVKHTWDSKNDYRFEETHYGFCADVITPEGKCTRVLQVKKDLTPYDIDDIDAQMDIEIDKAITNGSGFTRFQKFMDWFLPVWLVAFTATALTYAFDPDVRSLFNEIAMNTLISLGLVKEAPLIDTPAPVIVDKTTNEPITAETNPSQVFTNETINLTGVASLITPRIDVIDTIIITQIAHSEDVPTRLVYQHDLANGIEKRISTTLSKLEYDSGFNGTTTQYKDDALYYEYQSSGLGLFAKTNYPELSTAQTIIEHNYVSSETGKAVNKTEVISKTGTSLKFKTLSTETLLADYPFDGVHVSTPADPRPATMETGTKITIYTNADSVEYKPYQPFPEDILPNITVPKTKYENDSGEVTLVPPIAIPLTQTSTGQTVTVEPNPIAGEEPILTNEDGQPVPDDDVTADDPVITESPEGVPQVEPPVTSTNPNPVPIPLSPAEPPPPPPDAPPPPPEDSGGGKPNIPLSLLLGLFKLLFAIIFYLIRMFTFIVTIQFIAPIPIPNPYFIWFTTAEILGVQPYPLVKNIALFFLSFSIYKSIRRVFG